MIDVNRFIIFLDMDGVLVPWHTMGDDYEADGEHAFNQESVNALNAIITYYDADLCMITSWNSSFRNEDEWKTFLVNRGVIVNDLTIGNQHNRLETIMEYINNGLKYYLIIDDEACTYYMSIPKIEYRRILQTNRYRGLDLYDLKNVTVNWKLKN